MQQSLSATDDSIKKPELLGWVKLYGFIKWNLFLQQVCWHQELYYVILSTHLLISWSYSAGVEWWNSRILLPSLPIIILIDLSKKTMVKVVKITCYSSVISILVKNYTNHKRIYYCPNIRNNTTEAWTERKCGLWSIKTTLKCGYHCSLCVWYSIWTLCVCRKFRVC